jgi:uncharacterized protein (TIGR00369 family)
MTFPIPVKNPKLFEPISKWICNIPHCKILQLELVQAERGKVVMRIPYQERLVADSRTGVMHGGVITALVDTASGLSIFTMLEELLGYPTLDLRIDYLRPATPGLPVYCEAETYRLAKEIAFTRATAYQEGNPLPVATSVGTFMRRRSPKGGQA